MVSFLQGRGSIVSHIKELIFISTVIPHILLSIASGLNLYYFKTMLKIKSSR